MSDAKISNIAAAINAAHASVESAKQAMGEAAFDCGRLLAEAKAVIPHGGWDAWVKENCKFSMRTAQLYMRIHREAAADPEKAQRVADLSLREIARAFASSPKDHASAQPTQELDLAWHGAMAPAKARFIKLLAEKGDISESQRDEYLANVSSQDEAVDQLADVFFKHVPREKLDKLCDLLRVSDNSHVAAALYARRSPAPSL